MTSPSERLPLVIVPARNESAVISETLNSLLASDDAASFRILVVANGCTDDTAVIARSVGVEVLELARPGKTSAINAALADNPNVAIAVVDADVVVSKKAIMGCFELLASDASISACAPPIDLSLTESTSWFVREFIRFWSSASYFGDGLVGAGYYAIGSEARRTIEPLPDIGADDLYVIGQFAAGERATLGGEWFRPQMPKTLRKVLRQERRRERARTDYLKRPDGDAGDWNRTRLFSTGDNTLYNRAKRSPVGAAVFLLVRLWSRIGRTSSLENWEPGH